LPKSKPMVRTITATEAKNRFGSILQGAYQRAEHLVIERDGIPVAVIIPVQDYERLMADDLADEDLQRLSVSTDEARARARLREFLAEAQSGLPNVSDEEVDDDIQEAIQAIRNER
jgi:prevent-host-death family protein